MSHNIDWNPEGKLISRIYDDIYFSSENGLQESQDVFLKQNQLQERFQNLEVNAHFIIAETGFGTGLNFLATCMLWQETAPASAHLHFISVEKFPLPVETINHALQPWPILDNWRSQLIQYYPATVAGVHAIHFSHNIHLTLIIDDACNGLKTLQANPFHNTPTSQEARQWSGVDAWFLDGFAPAKNPDMWTQELFHRMATLSHSQTTVATFTAAGCVKRGLTTAGFTVKKISGYGRKREMIVAHRDNTRTTDTTSTQAYIKSKTGILPWALQQDYRPLHRQASVAVIGGGLAGCHTANSLAQKGYRVTVFEKHQIASGASGNAQGIVYAKLSPNMEPQGAFNLYSLLYAQRIYRDYWQKHSGTSGQQCGVLQLGMNAKTVAMQQKVAAFFKDHPQLVAYLSAQEASDIAGTTIRFPALHFPASGWVVPANVCQWLIKETPICVRQQTHINALQLHHGQWQLQTNHGDVEDFQAVVICNAYDAKQLLPDNHLPIKKIRGQVTHYPTNNSPSHQDLQLAICGEGYMAPATLSTTQPAENFHCLGASFNLNDNSTELHITDHIDNLSKVTTQVPDIVSDHNPSPAVLQQLTGRVSFRCTTPDYLPIVGGVAIDHRITEKFSILQHNAQQIPNVCGDYYPNLFLNIGHGSRGLSYTPLCAEIITSLISGSPPPLPQALIQRLNPARFLIRDLIRNE